MLENFHLRVFRAVAQHLSFRKAGEQLYLTQPVITLQIKALEQELGAQLLERSTKGVTLTAAGIKLKVYAGKLASLALEAENDLASIKGKAAGELVLGSSNTIANYILPQRLAEFARTYPAVRLSVTSGNTGQIAEGVFCSLRGTRVVEGGSDDDAIPPHSGRSNL